MQPIESVTGILLDHKNYHITKRKVNIPKPNNTLSLCVTSDERYTAVGTNDSSLHIYDNATKQLVQDIRAPLAGKFVRGISFQKDTHLLLAVDYNKWAHLFKKTGGSSNIVRNISIGGHSDDFHQEENENDAETNSVEWILVRSFALLLSSLTPATFIGYGTSCAFSNDQEQFIVGTAANYVLMYSLSQEEVGEGSNFPIADTVIPASTNGVSGVKFSPCDKNKIHCVSFSGKSLRTVDNSGQLPHFDDPIDCIVPPLDTSATQNNNNNLNRRNLPLGGGTMMLALTVSDDGHHIAVGEYGCCSVFGYQEINIEEADYKSVTNDKIVLKKEHRFVQIQRFSAGEPQQYNCYSVNFLFGGHDILLAGFEDSGFVNSKICCFNLKTKEMIFSIRDAGNWSTVIDSGRTIVATVHQAVHWIKNPAADWKYLARKVPFLLRYKGGTRLKLATSVWNVMVNTQLFLGVQHGAEVWKTENKQEEEKSKSGKEKEEIKY